MGNVLLEHQLPGVMGSDLSTNKACVLGSTLSVAGAATFSGAVTQKANLISGQGATATLTAAQSGSTVLFDRAAGIIYTLPAPAVGMFFDFITTVTITSNNAEIDTDAGTTFLLGAPIFALDATTPAAAAGPKIFAGNGTSHIKVQMNGSTTGGIKGGWLRFTCVSATVWNVTGVVLCTGTIATPFA